MIKEFIKSIGIMIKYAKAPTIFTLVGLLVQSIMMPLSIFFTGNLVNTAKYLLVFLLPLPHQPEQF